MSCQRCAEQRRKLLSAVKQGEVKQAVKVAKEGFRIIVEKQSEKSATVSKKRVATPEQS